MTDNIGEFDPQDQAEAFDEDISRDPGQGPGPDMTTFEELPDVLDVTRALGDADVDDVLGAEDADEIDDEELSALGDDLAYEDDEDAEDDTIVDALEDEPEDTNLYGDDDEDDLDTADGMAAVAADEAELEYVESLDETTSNAGRAARHLESRGELSDDDLEELGYKEDGDE